MTKRQRKASRKFAQQPFCYFPRRDAAALLNVAGEFRRKAMRRYATGQDVQGDCLLIGARREIERAFCLRYAFRPLP